MLLACLIPARLRHRAQLLGRRDAVAAAGGRHRRGAARRLPVRAARTAGEQADPGRPADVHRGDGHPGRAVVGERQRFRGPGPRRAWPPSAIGLALSHELSVLLSEGITEPIGRVRRALARVQSGDLTARVPVTTSDELGELAHDFNLMARGLEEREQMRDGVRHLHGQGGRRTHPVGAVPARRAWRSTSRSCSATCAGFTSYAENAAATEVVATLNRLFEVMVPIVDRHGGHVDKFIGDGLLAVFGAPEPYPDHADRAVAAACDIVAAVNVGEPGSRVGRRGQHRAGRRGVDRRRRPAELQRDRGRRQRGRPGRGGHARDRRRRADHRPPPSG